MSIFSKIADIFKKKDNTPAAQETAPTQVAPAAGSSNSTTPAGNVFKPAVTATMTAQKGSSGKKKTVDVGFTPISYEEFSPSSKNNLPSLSDRSKANDAASGIDWSNASARQKQYNDTYYKTLDDPTHTKMYRDLETAARYSNDATKEYRANRDALDDELDKIAKEKGKSSDEYRALQKFVDDYTELGRKMASRSTTKAAQKMSQQMDDMIQDVFAGYIADPSYQEKVAKGKQEILGNPKKYGTFTLGMRGASEQQKDLLYAVFAEEGEEGAKDFYERFLSPTVSRVGGMQDFAKGVSSDSKFERFLNTAGGAIGGAMAGDPVLNGGIKRGVDALTGKSDPLDSDVLVGDYTVSDAMDSYLKKEFSGVDQEQLDTYGKPGFKQLGKKEGIGSWYDEAKEKATDYEKQLLGLIYLASEEDEDVAKDFWRSLQGRAAAIQGTVNGGNFDTATGDAVTSQLYQNYLDQSKIAQMLYKTAVMTGSMGTQRALAIINPILSGVTLGFGVFGNAYNEARAEGKARGQSLGYAASEGFVEGALETLVGSVSNLAGFSVDGAIENAFLKRIASPYLRAAIRLPLNFTEEGTEEYLENYADVLLRNLWFSEKNKFEPLSQENLDTFLYAGLSSLILGGGEEVRQIKTDLNFAELGKALNDQGSVDKLVDTILNNPIEGSKKDPGVRLYKEAKELAQKIKDGKLKANDINVGETFSTYNAALGQALAKYVEAGGDASFLTNPDTVAYNKETLTPDDLLAGATSMLVDLGGNVELADAIVKAATNQTLTQEQLEAIQNDQAAVQVLSQLLGELDMTQDTALTRAARNTTRKSTTGNKVYDTLKTENTNKTVATPVSQRLYDAGGMSWSEAEQISGVIEKVMNGTAITEDEAELITISNAAVRSMLRDVVGVELDEDATIGRIMDTLNGVAANMASVKEMQSDIRQNAEQVAKARMPIPPAQARSTITLGDTEYSHDEFVRDYMNQHGVSQAVAEQAWQQRATVDAALSGEEESNGQQRTSHDQGRDDLGERRGSGENPSGTDQSGPVAQPGRRGSDAAGSAATGVRGVRVSDDAVATDGENADTLQDQYPDIVDLTDRLKKSGFTRITYVTKGNIFNSLGQRVPGVCIGTELILSLDYKVNGYNYVATATHEEVHLKLNLLRQLVGEDEVNRFVSAALQSLLTKEQYTDAFRAYVKRYGPVYAAYDSETRAHMINEEIFADMVAGISNFGTTLGEFSEDAAAYMEDSNLNTVAQNIVDGLENPGEITNIEYVEGLPHEIPVDTLISDKNVDSPSTAPVDPGDTSRFAFFGLAEALGFTVDTEGKEKVYYGSEEDAKAKRNGFTQVTVEQVADSPIGQLIQYSVENGYITKEDAKHELELFASIGSITDKTRDFYMSMQFMGSTIFTAMKANSDKQYGTTYDFPSICTKTQAVVDNMSAQMVELGRALTEDEIKDTYNKVFNDGNPVTCPECYVFTRWVGIGGLLDHIKHYQDTYAAMTPTEVVKEYYTQLDELMKYAEANGLTKGKAKGSLASKLDKDMADLAEAIQTKENQGKSVPKKDYDRLQALESQATTINALSWLEKVYFGGKTPSVQNVNKNFVVPNDVLFDLNNGEAFARDYPGTWAFRTSQGAGYGKAIAPYAEATLGEGILVTANTTNTIKNKAEAGRAGRRMDNPFLTEKGPIKPNSKRDRKLESAKKKQLNQLFIGGQRFQSTSDARFDNAVDYLLSALEMQAMGGGAQVYTKVLGAVPFFEATNMCANMSMMPYGGGLDANNQPVDSKVGGVDPEVAQEMRLKSEHAGTITIGVNDAHIRAMFNQVFRDFIIPYHASGGKMSLIEYFRQVQDPSLKGTRIKSSDYTKTQSDRILSDEILRQDLGKSEREVDNIHRFREMRLWILTGGKTGKMDLDIMSTSTPGLTESQINARSILQSLYASMQKGGKWHGVQLAKSKVEAQIFPNEFWDTSSTYETSNVNTQRYLDYCDALGFLHRFSGQTVARGKASDGTTRNVIKPVKGYDKNGEEIQLTDLAYKYDKDGNRTDEIEPFFWKTLTDRRMYGNAGQYLEQPRVTLANLNDETVTTFASPMGERRYDRKQSLKTAQELVAKRRAEGTMPKARLSIQDTDLTEAQQAIVDFNNSQTEVGSELRHLSGPTNKQKRYQNNVGKEVSGKIFVHKLYADEVIKDPELLRNAEAALKTEYPDFEYNCIAYDPKTGDIRFDEAPDFDTADEPIPGWQITVTRDGKVKKPHYENQIWHHKWQWVKNDYQDRNPNGFDVGESWDRSRQYLNHLRSVPMNDYRFSNSKNSEKGSFAQRGIPDARVWGEQLRYFGLDDMIHDERWKEKESDVVARFSISLDSPIFDSDQRQEPETDSYGSVFYIKPTDSSWEILRDDDGNLMNTQYMKDVKGFNIFDNPLDPMPPRGKQDRVFSKSKMRGHKTQKTGETVSTYDKIGTKLEEVFGKEKAHNLRILDASSGTGFGTQALLDRGFNVTDLEPFPPRIEPKSGPIVEPYVPNYRNYGDLIYAIETGQEEPFDIVISNAVINVMAQDARAEVIAALGKFAKPDGHIFINTFGKTQPSKSAPNKVIQPDTDKLGREVYTVSTDTIQKGFTTPELKGFIRDVLNQTGTEGFGFSTVKPPKGEKSLGGMTTWIDMNGETIEEQGRSQQPDARFSIADENHNDWAPEFYSKMERVIDDWTNGKGQPLGAKMAANQVVGWLKGKGVKSEEIKWSGIVPYLEGKKTVTKEELQQVMAGNEVKIETKTLESGRGYTFWSDRDWDTVTADSLEDLYEYGYYLAEQDGFDPEYLRIYPSDDGYYITRDDTGEILVDAKRSEAGDTRWSDYTLDGGENYREILFKMPSLGGYTNQAMRVHWDEPDVIAHARVQDMEDSDGGKVLFVEEIQSDLHNAGTQNGFASQGKAKSLKQLRDEFISLREQINEDRRFNEISRAISDRFYDNAEHFSQDGYPISEGAKVLNSALGANLVERWMRGFIDYPARLNQDGPAALDYLKSEILTKEEYEEIESIRKLHQEFRRAKEAYEEAGRNSFAPNTPDVPFAGSSDTYHEFVMKHLLRLAAEGDYDKLGWTTAQQQSDRWSDEYAEGYRIEYDQNLPKFMNKYGKQWGAKVGSTELDNGYEVWSVDITPEMKDSVLHEGQPRFSMAPDEETTENQNDSTNPYKEGSFESMAFDLIKKAQNPDEFQNWINELRQKQADAKEAGKLKAPVIPSADKATPVNKTQQKIRENQLAKLLEKYGAFKQGEKAARDMPIPEKISDDRRVRRYVRTAAEAEATPQRLAERIGGETLVNELLSYTPITDSDAMANANHEFNRLGYKKALKEWQGKSSTDHFPTKNDIAFGSKLLVEAMRNGDDAVAMQALADLAAMETQAGQVAQAARLLKQLGPSGQLYYIQKAVDRLNHQNEGRIAKGTMDPITIDQDLAKAVMLAETQKEMDDAMEALKQDIADKLPVTLKDRWDAWRYLAMLGNPRTHFRNYLGNWVFSPVRFAKDLLAAAGEKMFIQDESQRTKDTRALLKDPRYDEIRQFAEEDFKVMEPDLTGDGKMNPLNEIMGMRKVLPGILDKASRKNDDLLKKEDVIFLRKAYVSALTQFIAARGLSLEDLSSGSFESNKLMNEARRYAALEAQKATYRDFSRVAAALNSLRRAAPGLSPFLDGLMPFTKTPINILKRGLEYSPAGLAKALTVDLKKVQKGDMTAAEAIDHVAAGMTGTGVALLGWLLASLGMARGGADDDDKKDKLEKAQGHQDYSLEIGGKSYTIDWMAPVALPFFVGVEAYNQLTGEGQASFMDFVNAVTLIAEPMMSLSMLDGINSTLSAVRSGSNSPIQSVATNILASYISQGAPTLLGQIARTIDPDRRSTYVDKNSENPAFMQRFVQNLQGKVPVLAGQKMAYVDTWGRKDTNESIILRGLENFISPGYANRVNETPVDTELLRLAEATGNNKVLPSEAAKYFQVEGETLNLNAKQYEQYKTTTGQTAFKLLGDLFADPVYAAMDDAQKANAVEQAMKIATAIGKQDVAPTYKTDGWIQRAIDHDNLETASMFHMLKNADTGLSNYQLISAMDWLNDEEKGELVMQEHPNTYRQMTDYTRKGYKFTLTDENIAREREIYEGLFWPAYNELVSSSKFQKASVAKQADMLSKMQSTLGTEARKRLGKELRSAGIKSHKPSNADVPDNVTNLYDLLNRP